MLDVIRSQKKEQASPAREEFMTYSCNELNKGLIDYARTYLNETEETKEKGLQELKEFVESELNINGPEDIYLLCFLRSRKFDVKRACSLLRKGVEFVNSYRDLFEKVNSEAVRHVITSNIVGFLPYRDSKGRCILLVRAERWDPDVLKAEDVIFGSMVSLHIAADNQVNQVAGFVVILDLKNLSLNHITRLGSWLIWGVQALQKCCPCLVKEFHFIHAPAVFRTVWKLVKPLITEKIKKRITIYKSSNWDSLHRNIPPCILPEELGGQLGPYSHEHWAKDIPLIEKKYYEKCQRFLTNIKLTSTCT